MRRPVQLLVGSVLLALLTGCKTLELPDTLLGPAAEAEPAPVTVDTADPADPEVSEPESADSDPAETDAGETDAGETDSAESDAGETDGEAAEAEQTALAALPNPALPAPPPIPHIYMALQHQGAGKPVSVIFAIDASRDNTPSDDAAVRLTPEGGLCNPQEMRNYNFPSVYGARPIVSEIEQAEGLTATDLPSYMAISVTNEMLNLNLAEDPEETRALNICTRKLWERLVAAQNQPGLASQ